MKKIKFSILAFGLFLSSSLILNAQSSCDTTPDPGQTVGRCFTVSGQYGDMASCNVQNSGTICFFGQGSGGEE